MRRKAEIEITSAGHDQKAQEKKKFIDTKKPLILAFIFLIGSFVGFAVLGIFVAMNSDTVVIRDTFIASVVGTALGSVPAVAAAILVWLHQRRAEQASESVRQNRSALMSMQQLSHQLLRLCRSRDSDVETRRAIVSGMKAYEPALSDVKLWASAYEATRYVEIDFLDGSHRDLEAARLVTEWLDSLVLGYPTKNYSDLRPKGHSWILEAYKRWTDDQFAFYEGGDQDNFLTGYQGKPLRRLVTFARSFVVWW